jgi:hypothetical protein
VQANYRNGCAKVIAFLRSKGVKTASLPGIFLAVIFLVYAWFITYGNFTTWKHTTHYYTQLADAFSKGQLHVDRKPGRALLEAPDPYSNTDRRDFSLEIWDLSLYKEKLYLYWGPVPALIITPLQMAFGWKITDNYLVFLFYTGLSIVNTLIVVRLRNTFFPGIPIRNMYLCIALMGLILPVSWSLSTPNVYSAAIGAGQFFLMGGMYFLLAAIKPDAQPDKRALFVAGVFWACCVGSRAINVLSVIFLAAFVSLWLVGSMPKPVRWREYLQVVSALYVPLIVGAVMIGWYNWARFDSPFEFGLRYQITIFNLNRDIGLTFRPEYFPYNLYLYVFQPFEVISRFPFIQPVEASVLFGELGIRAPYLYIPGRLTGLLFGAPFLILSLAGLFLKQDAAREELPSNLVSRRRLIIALLTGSFLINFSAILFYFFGQMRFLVDVTSQITLLAVIGYWRILSFRQTSNSFRSRSFVFVANSLAAITLCTSLILSLTGEAGRMAKLNPALFDRINKVFSISE